MTANDRLATANLGVAIAAFGVAAGMAVMQALSRANLDLPFRSADLYYLSVTAHGTLMALVFTTFFIMGLGYALSEELRFEGGKVLDANFGAYRLPRFSWVPRIETVLVPNDALSPQGGGEPAIINMGAVLANAIFDATGARLYRSPMTPARVLAALKA